MTQGWTADSYVSEEQEMLRATIKPDRTTAYVALLGLLIIYIVLFAIVFQAFQISALSCKLLKHIDRNISYEKSEP
jgi:hypothetical protein